MGPVNTMNEDLWLNPKHEVPDLGLGRESAGYSRDCRNVHNLQAFGYKY